MNTGLKIFMFAVGAVIIVLFIALGISTGTTGKSIAEIGTYQMKQATEDKISLLRAKYDGNSVIGSELVSLIEDTIEAEDPLSIVVRTLDGSRTDYNYIYDADNHSIRSNGTKVILKSKSKDAYINRNSLFLCDVKSDLNGNIICLWLEQEK